MKTSDLIRNLEALARMLPQPGSGATLHLAGTGVITHYDPEIEALHEIISKLKMKNGDYDAETNKS